MSSLNRNLVKRVGAAAGVVVVAATAGAAEDTVVVAAEAVAAADAVAVVAAADTRPNCQYRNTLKQKQLGATYVSPPID